MANSTVLSAGGVTVSAPGTLAGQLLTQINAIFGAATPPTVTTGTSATLPAAPTTGGAQALSIASSVNGALSIPSGYSYVLYNGGGALTGSDSTTAIIGDNLNYTGAAGTIVGTGSVGGGVNDSTDRAVLDFNPAAGGYTVNANGSGQTINVDSGTANSIFATGAGATINAGGGFSLVLATGGGDLVNESGADGAASVAFVGGGATTTVVGGAGADTIFAGSQIQYFGSTGTTLFIGGSGTSTMVAPANATVFSGAGGGDYFLQSNSQFVMVATGGSASAPATDNVSGGSVAPTVFGANNENMVLTGTASVGQRGDGTGAVVYMFGDQETIDGSQAGGHTLFFGMDQSLTGSVGGASFTGNETLVGSNTGGDIFAYYNSTAWGAANGAAHTVTIQNWQASDSLFLNGFSTNDLNAANTALAGGASQFTLSDGTTFKFVDAKPNSIAPFST